MKLYGIELQTKLIAVLPIFIIAAILESYFIYARFDDLDRALLERSQLLAKQLSSSSEYPVFAGDSSLLKQQVESALKFQDVSSITILDGAFSPILSIGDPLSIPTIQPSQADGVVQSNDFLRLYEPIHATQIHVDDLAAPSESREMIKPLGMVVIEFSKARLNGQKIEIVVFNVLVTLIAFSLTLLIALRVSRRITIPILGMRQAVIEIGAGFLGTRINPLPKVLELHELADGINRTARQLEQDRAMLEDRIRQATMELVSKKEEAEHASLTKTRFLAAASHDLRQPMHALGLFIAELQSVVTTQRQRKVVTNIEESVHAMSGLLNALLDISKLDAGVVVPQPAKINVMNLLQRLALNYQSVAATKSIRLHFSSCHHEIFTDPILLERILTNLISNALRYTPANGCIFVACRRRGKGIHIEVRDNGIGIPPEEIKNIFQEFVQLANKERDRSMGLGLGLAIVARLCNLLKFQIEVRSKPGVGSTFSVHIPVSSKILPQPASHTDNEDRSKSVSNDNSVSLSETPGKRILVVDDDILVRTGTEGLLTAWGYQVSLADSLAEVSQNFSKSDFDLIISDYRLPDGVGLTVPTLIQSTNGKNVNCILVTGDTSPDILHLVSDSGMHFLSKPVKPAKLRSLIQFLLKPHE